MKINRCRKCHGEARVSIFGNRVTCEDDDCENEGPYKRRERDAILAWNTANPEAKMTSENLANYNAMIARINSMPAEALRAAIERDECPYEPEHLKESPIGMHHCPVCGEMVLATLPHPRKKDLP